MTSETNVVRLVAAGVLPEVFTDVEEFVEALNALSPEEVDALCQIGAKVKDLQISLRSKDAAAHGQIC